MPAKPKLLILNGSHSEIPLIQAAKKLGYHVITTGNAPSLPGHAYADCYHRADYSDKEAILALAQNLSIDAICSCANDFGIITAAYVAEKMHLGGHDSYQTTVLLHQKDRLKQFFRQYQIPSPQSWHFNHPQDALDKLPALSLPLIVKPVDMTGGKGVSTIKRAEQYQRAITQAFAASREKRIVVETFFSGSQHSLSTFIIDQKVRFAYSDNEYPYLNPYFVATSTAPATEIEKYQTGLISAIETIAKTLELVDGIFHIQYLANGKEATIIDITRRCSGDMYPYPVSYATGTDWAKWIVKAETAMDCSDFPNLKQTGFYSRHCVMAEKNGIIQDIIIHPELKPYIIDQLFWWQAGDRIDDYLNQKAGIIFTRFETAEQMKKICLQLNKLISIKILEQ